MKKLIKILLLTLAVLFLKPHTTMGQEVFIGGDTVNSYVQVTKLWTIEESDFDSVDVADVSPFNVDDIVMLYQPKGFIVDSLGDGYLKGFRADAGNYAFLIIDSIIGNTIIFNNSADFLNPVKNGPITSQLIKVAAFHDVTVNNTLTAPAWNGSIGGVLALYVRGTLKLEADIDMSGKGFRGADPAADDYAGDCDTRLTADTDLEKGFYLFNAEDSAGLKGEGAALPNFMHTRGRYPSINGGGGGNARFSGGGGGANYFDGGAGGGQSSICLGVDSIIHGVTNGVGGHGFSTDMYQNDKTGNDYPNRLFFGGGGGSGTSNSSYPASAGGNGGGIVVVIADSIVSRSGFGIKADGMSVASSMGAGAGGGAGGCIVLDANGYGGNISLSAVGGDGGIVNNPTVYSGPGGGGGGGIYWVTPDIFSLPAAINEDVTSRGLAGYWDRAPGIDDDTLSATQGSVAFLKTDLRPPLRGFLFNTIPTKDTICSDLPNYQIVGSQPRGGLGAGSYTYNWITWDKDLKIWKDASGTNNAMHYTIPGVLDTTTLYARIVTSGLLPADTSLSFTCEVLPKITGNIITAADTVCMGNDAIPLKTFNILGGANVGTDETYFWEERTISGSFGPAEGIINNSVYSPEALPETKFYRRTVVSHVCSSISNEIKITVLNPIGNNVISSRDEVCYGTSLAPDILDGADYTGGDQSGLNEWYMWTVQDGLSGNYDTIIGAESPDLSVDSILHVSKRFRRTVYSGIDSACVDISAPFLITVLDTISGNQITTSESLICRDDTLSDAIGSAAAIAGGDNAYTYVWEVNIDGGGWTEDAVYPDEREFNRSFGGTTTSVRRILNSGTSNACTSTSNTLVINTTARILNNTITTPDGITICQDDPVSLNANILGASDGGDGEFVYEWLSSPDGSANSWSSFEATAEDSANYRHFFLDDTTYFRRVAWSGKTLKTCVDSSASIIVNIPPMITDNTIGADRELCEGEYLVITGSAPEGGPVSGNYDFEWYAGPADNISTSVSSDTSFRQANYADTLYFQRMITRGVCTSLSDSVQMYAVRLPHGRMTMISRDSVCEGENTVEFLVTLNAGQNDPAVNNYTTSISYNSPQEGSSGTISPTGTASGNSFAVFASPVTTQDVSNYNYHLESVSAITAAGHECLSVGQVTDPDPIIVVVNAIPSVTITSAPDSVCGVDIQLTASAEGGGADGWYNDPSLNPGISIVFTDAPGGTFDTISNSVNARISFDNNEEAITVNYVRRRVAWDTELRCGHYDTATVVHSRVPVDISILTSDQSYYFADSTVLEAQTPDAGYGWWEVAEGSAGFLDDISNPLDTAYTLDVGADNYFVWFVKNGTCGPYTDTVRIHVDDLIFYDAFSPNNDTYNDKLAIRGLEYARYIECYIYNSRGALVAELIKNDATGEDNITGQGFLEAGALPDARKYLAADDRAKVLWNGTRTNEDGAQFVEDGIYYIVMKVRRYEDEDLREYYKTVILKTRARQ